MQQWNDGILEDWSDRAVPLVPDVQVSRPDEPSASIPSEQGELAENMV